ncbi:MAG TPA: response regulator, partial [Anaerolineae bacterium]|nr:response regulator [Anaerolineae bacterium]
KTPDGLATLAALRAAAPHSAIIVLTSYPDSREEEAVLAAGAVAYVLKTLDTQALIQAIRSAPEAGLPDADPLEMGMSPKEGAARG